MHSITITSPLGDLIAIADDMHLHMLEFCDHAEIEKRLSQISFTKETPNKILNQTKQELDEYFEGRRKIFSLPLSPSGTDFQQKSWKALQKIPYGETRSYLEEATMVGNPRAVRAIGGANHANPIVIIIPCHRVIGKSGKLVGYGGGLERKIWLLEHEQRSKER